MDLSNQASAVCLERPSHFHTLSKHKTRQTKNITKKTLSPDNNFKLQLPSNLGILGLQTASYYVSPPPQKHNVSIPEGFFHFHSGPEQ